MFIVKLMTAVPKPQAWVNNIPEIRKLNFEGILLLIFGEIKFILILVIIRNLSFPQSTLNCCSWNTLHL